MQPMKVHLLADIGGTNARFALSRDGEISNYAALRVCDYPSIGAALKAYLDSVNKPQIDHALLAVAGPVAGNRCSLTNSPWVVDGSHLERDFRIRRVVLCNDLEAVAWSIPCLKSADFVTIGDGLALAQAPQIIVAPGTGLGVSAWLGQGVSISSEAGHASFAPENESEDDLLRTMRESHSHVSVERLLSGPGLVAIYRMLVAGSGAVPKFKTAAEVSAAAAAESCSFSYRALEHFCAILGSTAGNLALTFGARGGVNIAGGIAPQIIPFLSQSSFRQRFTAKGRFTEWLLHIPTRIIKRPDVALVGLWQHHQQENVA
jgi:glucokinase